MNKERRKILAKIVEKLDEARNLLDEVKSDEECVFDNMPENLQCSERGETMGEYISTMEDGVDTLEDIVSSLEEIIDG